MSVALEYAAKCGECKKPMRRGTVVDFIKDGTTYTYIHAVSCDDPMHDPAPVTVRRPHFEIRVCSSGTGCYGATGYGFESTAPPRCHLCGLPWVKDEPAGTVTRAQFNQAAQAIGRAA